MTIGLRFENIVNDNKECDMVFAILLTVNVVELLTNLLVN